MSDEDPIHRRYFDACRLLDEGRVVDAQREFERLTLDAPRFAPAWDGSARSLIQLGQFDGAMEHFRRAIRLDPASWRIRYHMAAALRGAGRPGEARAHLVAAQRRDASQRCVAYEEGLCWLDEGEPLRGVKALERALALEPREISDAVVWTAMGRCWAETDEFEAADEAFSKALMIEPRDHRVLLHWAEFAAQRGRSEEAERFAVSARSLNGGCEPDRLRLRLAMERGDSTAVEARLGDLAERAGPDEILAWRADWARRSGRPEEARRRALDLLRQSDGEDSFASELALGALRALRAEASGKRGFRVVVRIAANRTERYRTYRVVAADATHAERIVSEIETEFADGEWEIIELQRTEHPGGVLAGIYQLQQPKVSFPLQDLSQRTDPAASSGA